MRVATSALLACVLVLTACSDDGDPEEVVLPSPTASAEAPDDEPTPSPSPTVSAEAPEGDDGEIDVTTIPDEITPAYVEAVYDEISLGRLPYTVAVLEAPPNDLGAIPTGTRDGLRSWLAGTQLEVAVASLEDLANNTQRRADFRPSNELRPTRAEVLRVVEGNETCLVAVARLDDSGLSPNGGPRDVLTVLSFSPNSDQAENRTSWVLRDQLRNTDSDGQPNPDAFALEADLETIAASADITCAEADQ